MSSPIASLADVRAQLGVSHLVSQLAEADPATSLSAIAESLEGYDVERLRAQLGKTRGLAALLGRIEPDDLVDLDLELRVDALERARAQLRRLVLVTSREVGRRFVVLPPDVGGRGAKPRRDLRARLKVKPHAARLYTQLASVDDVAFGRVIELAAHEDVTIAKALRHASSDGTHSGSSWSTTPELLDATRDVLGEIHYDVASHLGAQACTVRARRWYSAEQPVINSQALAWASTFGLDRTHLQAAIDCWAGADGLDEGNPWVDEGERWPTLFGNVPFERHLVLAFGNRLLREIQQHPRLAAIWLLNVDPSRGDQQSLGELGLHCQIAKRTSFLAPHNGVAEDGNRASQVVFGVGGGLDREKFRRRFGEFGNVYQPSSGACSVAHVRELAEAHGMDRLQTQLDKLAAALV